MSNYDFLGGRKPNKTSNSGNSLSAVQMVDDARDRLIDGKKEMGRAIAKWAMSLNQSGEQNIGRITKEVSSMTRDLSDTERAEILSHAIAFMVANM